MENCKILTPKDKGIIPDYVHLFNKVLNEISPFYDNSEIQKARKKNTHEYIVSHLSPNPDSRFIGHFTNQTLDGLLIEGFDDLDGDRTVVNWVMAKYKGLGIGTCLIEDCISRAKSEFKNVVAVGVSRKNVDAIKLYENLGFIFGKTYNKGTMRTMGYIFD